MKIKTYIEEAFNELLNKVSWPTWTELQDSAVIVMTTSIIIGFVIYIVDSAFGNLMKLIYGLFY